MAKPKKLNNYVTLAAYARMKGVNPNAIQERLASGSISESSIRREGSLVLIDPDAADLDFEFLGDAERSENFEVMKPEPKDFEEDMTGLSPLEQARRHAASFKKAKIETERVRTRKLELEILTKEQKLLDVDEVKKRLVKIVGETRDAILNVPGRVAPLLFGAKSVLEIEKTLYEELGQALGSLARLGDEKDNGDQRG